MRRSPSLIRLAVLISRVAEKHNDASWTLGLCMVMLVQLQLLRIANAYRELKYWVIIPDTLELLSIKL
jgi:hypothetical protein